MTGYVPEVGDKVRVTLGETVIVGTVCGWSANGRGPIVWSIALDSTDLTVDLRTGGGWHFEHVQELPSKVGAVIRRADGRMYVRVVHAEPSRYCWVNLHGQSDWYTEAEVSEGEFTVLFEGVD